MRIAHVQCSGFSVIRRNFVQPAKTSAWLVRERDGGYRRFWRGAMVDSIAFDVNWIIASAVIGVLVAVIGAFLYPRRDYD
jgi:hypothetical protein